MPVEVIMPKVDMDMATGTLSVWHVADGERVEKGAPLFDIETDKAAMEVESPASGTLRNMLAAGSVVAVGSPVAWLFADGETIAAPAGVAVPVAVAAAAAPSDTVTIGAEAALTSAFSGTTASAASGAAQRAGDDGGYPAQQSKPRATPAARHLARATGVRLDGIAGTGPLGRVQRADVEIANLRDAPRLPEPTGAGQWQPQTGELHVTRRKGTGLPILLVHGFAADLTGWAPLERALPPDRPLIRIDLPCHGRSPLRRIATFAALARLLVDAFDRTGAERVHLVGHSLGGALGLALADIRPRQIASLTLIAPAGLGAEVDGATLMGIARASRSESLKPWLRRLPADPDMIDDGFVRAAMLGRRDPMMRAAQIDLADTLFPDGVQAFDVTAALGRLAGPAAIIWGRADRIIPWQHALAAPGQIALHLLHGCGHIPHVEMPGAVAEIVARMTA